MKYSELLKRAIADSGMSLADVAKACEDRGTKIDRSYVSVLAAGKVSPASEEVNRVLADVLSSTGLSFFELQFAALAEKSSFFADLMEKGFGYTSAPDTAAREMAELRKRIVELERELRALKSAMRGWCESVQTDS